jgi:hypothetical protein
MRQSDGNLNSKFVEANRLLSYSWILSTASEKDNKLSKQLPQNPEPLAHTALTYIGIARWRT